MKEHAQESVEKGQDVVKTLNEAFDADASFQCMSNIVKEENGNFTGTRVNSSEVRST